MLLIYQHSRDSFQVSGHFIRMVYAVDSVVRQRNLKDMETELNNKKKELGDSQKFAEKLKKSIKSAEEQRLELEEKKTALKTENASLERELEAMKKQVCCCDSIACVTCIPRLFQFTLVVVA